MKIDSTGFGRIVIDGDTYTSDVVIYPDGRIEDNWWRKNGHTLRKQDIENLLSAEPDIIVVGKGVFGRMKPEKGFETELEKKGIKVESASNKKAAQIYNELASQNRKIGACFHLTC